VLLLVGLPQEKEKDTAFLSIVKTKKLKGLASAIAVIWNFWRGDERFAFLSSFMLKGEIQ
jgi:hypothetical protein